MSGKVDKKIQRIRKAAPELLDALVEAYPILFEAINYLPTRELKEKAESAYQKAKLAISKAVSG
jgi:hypothetical protein